MQLLPDLNVTLHRDRKAMMVTPSAASFYSMKVVGEKKNTCVGFYFDMR